MNNIFRAFATLAEAEAFAKKASADGTIIFVVESRPPPRVATHVGGIELPFIADDNGLIRSWEREHSRWENGEKIK